MKKQYLFHKFNSSVLNFTAYHEQEEMMLVSFNSGAVWMYYGVSVEVFKSFTSAKSSGQFFNKNIRHQYDDECLHKEGATFVEKT